MTMPLTSKDLLGLRAMPPEDIELILTTAAHMKQFLINNQKKTPHLQGKSIVTLFYENSTRTRMSFELACKYMSAAAANISASTSSAGKGETLLDTGCTLDMMGTDLIIMRHPHAGAPHMLAQAVKAGIINAGDGMNEHPTQALLDMFTLREHLGGLQGITVAIVGDIAHSRVARSNIWGLTAMGARVVLCAPSTLMPVDIAAMGNVTIADTVEQAVEGAHAVMALRLQLERQQAGLFPTVREYHHHWGLNQQRMRLARPDALLMHPGPVNRGVELASALADGDQSVIRAQVQNGVAVRMAIMFLLTRRTAA